MSNLKDWIDSPEAIKLRELMEEMREQDQKSADEFWENLSYENKCNAFHAVVERIYKAEIKDNGSYRWALYDVFGFGPDMYGRGMDCGYMALHNSIMDEEDHAKLYALELEENEMKEYIHENQAQFDF